MSVISSSFMSTLMPSGGSVESLRSSLAMPITTPGEMFSLLCGGHARSARGQAGQAGGQQSADQAAHLEDAERNQITEQKVERLLWRDPVAPHSCVACWRPVRARELCGLWYGPRSRCVHLCVSVHSWCGSVQGSHGVSN